MKNEPKSATSGLKAAGVIALLASLLLLLPAASAGSYSMTVDVEGAPSVAEPGETVEFIYTLTNTGDNDLYNIEIDGLGNPMSDPGFNSILTVEQGTMVVSGWITMGEDNVYNSVCVRGYNSKDRLVVRSYAGCAVMAA